LYSIDKTHTRLKGDTYAIVTPSTAATTRTIRMARLMHGGNWNPEPAGWPRLAASLRADRKIDLKIEPMEIKDLAASGVKVAHLTGTGRLALTDEQRTALTDFVNAGGLLLVDAAGGE